jgi:hypothetical protein
MSPWTLGFVLAAAVVVVVAVLLLGILWQAMRILRLARSAARLVEEIERNTRSVWALSDTNAVGGQILDQTRAIDAQAAAVLGALRGAPASQGVDAA